MIRMESTKPISDFDTPTATFENKLLDTNVIVYAKSISDDIITFINPTFIVTTNQNG